MSGSRKALDWEGVYQLVEAQEGYFTAKQALGLGISRRVLTHHVAAGKLRRSGHGIYRWVQFPTGDHEELVVFWLWSGEEGVFSHESALMLHGLSDVLPSETTMTVPSGWSSRRQRVPEGLSLRYGDVEESERMWFGAVPVTCVRRTLEDCAGQEGFSPGILEQAVREALDRGLVKKCELERVGEALRPYGGIPS